MRQKTAKLPKGTIVPNHIAIVLDGNRRWARARGLHTMEGHLAGFNAGKKVAEAARDFGVHTVTVWGFSTENWDRSPEEVDYLMKLLKRFVKDVLKKAADDQVRFIHLGRKDRLPKDLVNLMTKVEKETQGYTKHVLNAALDYGGRDEILRAVQGVVQDKVPAEKIDEKLFSAYLDTADQPYPYPDLFIRPSGEQRTSGLLPWQMVYAEYYWESSNLPDFTPERLRDAIIDYSRRRRRFGGNDAATLLKFKPELTANLELNWWRLSKVPEGTRFRDFVVEYLAEQYGISKNHAAKAAKYMIWAITNHDKKDFVKAKRHLKSFYKLIKDHIKLAFEPEIAASLRIKFWQDPQDETARELFAEEFRISDFQAAKAAHLKVLAYKERALALSTGKEAHWKKAEDYLARHYHALKDRVA